MNSNEFLNNYPELFEYFNFLTKEAVEKANIDLYRRLAEKCSYDALIKLLYYDESAMDLEFVQKKRTAIEKKVRNGNDEKEKKIVSSIQKAAQGINPFPGRKKKFKAEANSYMHDYGYIISELQKIDKERKLSGNLIDKGDPEFIAGVKQIYRDFYQKECESEMVNLDILDHNAKDILDQVEANLAADLNTVNPFDLAKIILAKKYGYEFQTLEKNIPRGFITRLKSRFRRGEKIDKEFVDKLTIQIIDQELDSKISALRIKKDDIGKNSK